MNHHSTNTGSPRPFLVAVGDSQVLIDAANARLLVLNEEGARLWRAIEQGARPQTPAERAFAEELARPGIAPAPLAEAEGPRVLARAPLQVAANTSDPNPFSADSGW